MRWLVLASLALTIAPAQTPQEQEAARWMERGQAALAAYRYKEAADAFQHAIGIRELDAVAHAYLARALLGEAPFNPRLMPDSEGILARAEAEAKKAVELSPASPDALAALATVEYKVAAKSRNFLDPPPQKVVALWQKVLEADPRNAEAHTELARLAIEQVAQPILLARMREGIKIGERVRLKDDAERRKLQEQLSPVLEEGFGHARAALEIDPKRAVAMRAMAGLYTARANLSDSDEDYAADMRTSADWEQKATAATPAPPPPSEPSPAAKQGGVIGAIISSIPTAAPPVPPGSLLKSVQPVYPEEARRAGVRGTVILQAVIGTDGRVKALYPRDGPAILIKAAEDAVRQWVYQPFIVDGAAREKTIDISLTFGRPAKPSLAGFEKALSVALPHGRGSRKLLQTRKRVSEPRALASDP